MGGIHRKIDRMNVELDDGTEADVHHGLVRESVNDRPDEREVRVDVLPGIPENAIIFTRDGDTWPKRGVASVFDYQERAGTYVIQLRDV